jgi:hypothetical protein
MIELRERVLAGLIVGGSAAAGFSDIEIAHAQRTPHYPIGANIAINLSRAPQQPAQYRSFSARQVPVRQPVVPTRVNVPPVRHIPAAQSRQPIPNIPRNPTGPDFRVAPPSSNVIPPGGFGFLPMEGSAPRVAPDYNTPPGNFNFPSTPSQPMVQPGGDARVSHEYRR